MAYLPILGNAGTIVFTWYINSTLIMTRTVDIAGYGESYIECGGNFTVFTEDDKAIKSFTGYRREIEYTVTNSYLQENAATILDMFYAINYTRSHKLTSRIIVNYRAGSWFGVINDAIFTESPSIIEISNAANTAQSLSYKVSDKNIIADILFGQVTDGGALIAENDSNLILEIGGKLLLELDKYAE